MNKFYRWLLRKVVKTTILKKDETIVFAFRDEFKVEDLERISEEFQEILGDKVVFIGGVDKIIVV